MTRLFLDWRRTNTISIRLTLKEDSALYVAVAILSVIILLADFGKFSVHDFCINFHIPLIQLCLFGSCTLLYLQNVASWLNSPPFVGYIIYGYTLGLLFWFGFCGSYLLWIFLYLIRIAHCCFTVMNTPYNTPYLSLCNASPPAFPLLPEVWCFQSKGYRIRLQENLLSHSLCCHYF